MHQSHMLINGEQVVSQSGKVEIIHNPANQEPVAEVAVGSRHDACLALEAAKRAFPIWSATSCQKRAKILHPAADLVRQRSEEIARLLTLEQGKPLKNARVEMLSSADVLDYYAEEGKRNFGEWIAGANSRSIVLRQPIGVAALITPWNFPVDLLAWKVAPALAAGCTIVAKPPSLAPLAASGVCPGGERCRAACGRCQRGSRAGRRGGGGVGGKSYLTKNCLYRRDRDRPLDHGPCRGPYQARLTGAGWPVALHRLPVTPICRPQLLPPPSAPSPTWARSASASIEFMWRKRWQSSSLRSL